jgi:hypothetical protein
MKILNRYTNAVIYEDNALTIAETIVKAVESGASLDGARLDGASLDGASLVDARLDGARLDGASLDGASLVDARLDGARLDGASLVGASLVGARLDGASLVGARLDGARLNWSSHDLLAELLLRLAGKNIAHRSAAGLVLVSRDWCWGDFAPHLQFTDGQWLRESLIQIAKDHPDGVPEIALKTLGIQRSSLDSHIKCTDATDGSAG